MDILMEVDSHIVGRGSMVRFLRGMANGEPIRNDITPGKWLYYKGVPRLSELVLQVIGFMTHMYSSWGHRPMGVHQLVWFI